LKDQIERELQELADAALETRAEAESIASVVSLMVERIRLGGTIYWCGNGGSAAEALHLSTELLGRLRFDRPAIRSLSLAADPVFMTAASNDYSFEDVFERQVTALVGTNDCLVAMSTSGNSENVVRAAARAKSQGALVVAFTGNSGGSLSAQADRTIRSHSEDTQHIQEIHLAVGHTICGLIEDVLYGKDAKNE
jgi:D-sedoheptulose 7-phosphate isomerase